MKVLFISGLYSEKLRLFLNKECPYCLQNAPDVFQWAIVEGLNEIDIEYEIISYPFLPCYPNYNFLSVLQDDIMYNNKCIGKVMTYSTIPLLKQYSISSSIIRYVENKIKEINGEQLVILTYSPQSYFLKPIIKLKKKYKNILLATIVTDLIDDVLNFKVNTSILKKIQNKIEFNSIKKAYCGIDKFILLSRPMIEKIPEAENKSIVVEGIVSKKEWNEKYVNNKIRSLFYAGTLQEFSGVRELLYAFHSIPNENYRLVICGQGTLTPEIEKFAKQDCRIIYLGMQPREEVLRLQLESTLLINPRRPDSSITRFSFPSKTIEYMASGTPMIGYKLEGIPVEYYENYYTIDELDEKSLSDTINVTMALPQEELNLKAKKAYEFVMKNKTAYIQVKRILDFVSNI